MNHTCSILLCIGVTAASAGATPFSAEVAVDPPVAGVSFGTKQGAAVAFDGTDYLVVWSDFRELGSPEIFGARVSAGGAVLDPVGFRISAPTEDSLLAPRVAFDGTNYLVVWMTESNRVYADRVSPAGTVLDASPIELATAGESPDVVFDGSDYLVAYTTATSNADIVGLRVGTDGTVVQGPVTISAALGSQSNSRVAFDGTNFLVAWQDSRLGSANSEIYVARVTTSLSVLDADGIPLGASTTGQESPVVAFDGTSYLVAWQDAHTFPNAVHGQRMATSGATLGSELVISSQGSQPTIAFDGSDQLVAWTTGSGIAGTRVSPAGVVRDAPALTLSPSSIGFAGPALARGASGVLAAWSGYPHNNGESSVYGTRVSTAGVILDPSAIAISTAANTEQTPAIASAATSSLAVWVDSRCANGTNGCTYAARLAPDGTALDAHSFEVIPFSANMPAVASDGSDYLVVAATSGWITAARVAGDGSVLDAVPLHLPTTSSFVANPRVAYVGGVYLVVWAAQYRIEGVRVRPDGTILILPRSSSTPELRRS